MGHTITRTFLALILMTYVVFEVQGQTGTTPDIKSIFAKRCNDFQAKNISEFQNNPKNCTALWNLFLGSFAGKPVCAVTPDSYLAFFNAANYTASINNEAMFWAFVNPFVYNFTASQPGKYVTIKDLLPGYILDDLIWCWSMTKGDLDYDSCPTYKNCTGGNEAVKSFWKKNSEMFAGLATEKVFAMLNGSKSDGGAFTNQSLFYTIEVPSMSSPRIMEMQVILVHDPSISFSESCFNGTLTILSGMLNQKQIKYSCEEDPPDVRHLQCQIHPEYRETGYCSVSSTLHHFTLWTLLNSAVGIFLFGDLAFANMIRCIL